MPQNQAPYRLWTKSSILRHEELSSRSARQLQLRILDKALGQHLSLRPPSHVLQHEPQPLGLQPRPLPLPLALPKALNIVYPRWQGLQRLVPPGATPSQGQAHHPVHQPKGLPLRLPEPRHKQYLGQF